MPAYDAMPAYPIRVVSRVTHISEYTLRAWERRYRAVTPRSYLGWGKSHALGTGLGLAIGAKLAAPDKFCVNFMGDAAFGMTGLDFETAVRCGIPILTVVLNNSAMAIEIPHLVVSHDKYGTRDIGGRYADLGRAMGGWDEMVFRTMVRDDAYIYDVVGLESEGTSADFQTGANSYLYGTRFMTWLSYTYGPDKLLEWITRDENTRRYFAARFAQVYGMPLDEAWKRWIADEHRWQQANLQAIRKYPVTKPERISKDALGGVSRSYYDPQDRVMYVAIRHPGEIANIAAIQVETGAERHLKEIKGPGLYYVTSLAFDAAERQLFYTTDNNNWRDLYSYDVTTHRSRRLIRDARIGDGARWKADASSARWR